MWHSLSGRSRSARSRRCAHKNGGLSRPDPALHHKMLLGPRALIIKQQEWKWDRNHSRMKRSQCQCLDSRPHADCCPHLAPMYYLADKIDESVYKLRQHESLVTWLFWNIKSSRRRLPRDLFANTYDATNIPARPYEEHNIAHSSRKYRKGGRVVGTREPTLN